MDFLAKINLKHIFCWNTAQNTRTEPTWSIHGCWLPREHRSSIDSWRPSKTRCFRPSSSNTKGFLPKYSPDAKKNQTGALINVQQPNLFFTNIGVPPFLPETVIWATVGHFGRIFDEARKLAAENLELSLKMPPNLNNSSCNHSVTLTIKKHEKNKCLFCAQMTQQLLTSHLWFVACFMHKP